ncbi:MAG: dTDP-4-dehydrorhamnose 3,5-epimerase [Paraglaciecola sp.]|jgi:dTDP-4-dehydrorhamnose 3,5-epimerase
MNFIETPIKGLIICEPTIWGDDRGYFYEAYNEKVFHAGGITAKFVQDNQAFSTQGILRGLHYQVGEFAQAKLVRVLQGEVLDVAVDVREGSATYGQSYSTRLSGENKRQMFVPRGFAHGYVVLSETAEFAYKCDNLYSKAHEGGLRYNDPALKIDWQFDLSKVQVAERDATFPDIGKHRVD